MGVESVTLDAVSGRASSVRCFVPPMLRRLPSLTSGVLCSSRRSRGGQWTALNVDRPPSVSHGVFDPSPYEAWRSARGNSFSTDSAGVAGDSPVPGMGVSSAPSGTMAPAESTVRAESSEEPLSERFIRYESHAALVEDLLRLNGDPLELNGRIVTYRGHPSAKLMIIGEAPGKDEDAAGVPFVGKAGQLLDDIFTYAGFDMDKQVYISNVAKRRPPNNRNPTDLEIEYYLPWLLEEVRLVDPAMIILAGAVPLKAVLNLKGITKIRGQVINELVSGKIRDVVPILHPAYLLRNPRAKLDMKVDIDKIRMIYMQKFPEDTLAEPRLTKPRRGN